MTGKQFAAMALNYLGLKEEDGSYQVILDLYNENRNPGDYKMTASDPWCAAFISAMAAKAGLKEKIPFSCSCREMIRGFEKKGSYAEADDYIPAVGDIIFYDWEGSQSFDSVGHDTADHVGIVAALEGENISVLEGNRSDAVGVRKIPVGSPCICGYGVWEGSCKLQDSSCKETGERKASTWQGGACKGEVPSSSEAEGVDARKTEVSGKDGTFGSQLPQSPSAPAPSCAPLPEGAILEFCSPRVPVLRSASSGSAVEALQLLLNGLYNEELEVDGEFGPLTCAAVYHAQEILFPDEEQEWDGVVGSKTWGKLLQ